jgi:serine protease Do
LLLTAAALAWFGIGDPMLTRGGYAMDGADAQAAEEQLAQLQDLSGVQAVSRAFRLAANRARPGVVHIHVGGPSLSAAQSDVRERLRQLLEEFTDERVAPEELDRWLEGRSRTEHDQRIRELLEGKIPQEQLDELRQRWQEEQGNQGRSGDIQEYQEGSGSGIIFDKDGYILTNNHVVQGRNGIRVVLDDNREFEAELIGTDPKTDLAVIRIEATDLSPLTFGDSDQMEVGDWVLAVGAPFGLEQTVTHGIVSAKGRTRRADIDIAYQDFIQTDAAINPGNSGGPLLNLRGEVVGVNTAIATNGEGFNAGIAFTIPSNRAARVARQLMTRGVVRRGYLGIVPLSVSPRDVEIFGLPSPGGVLVDRVLRDSPADRAGLRVEDVIVAMNGKEIRGLEHFRLSVAELSPRDRVHMRVLRDGKELELVARLALQPDDLRAPALRDLRQDSLPVDRLALSGRTYRPELASQLVQAYGRHRDGVVVWCLDPDARRLPDVEPLELIVSCQGRKVRCVGDLKSALAAVPSDQNVRLEVMSRNGDRRTVLVRPDIAP